MDFFLRYLQFREHAYAYVSEGEAETVLGLEPLLERSSSEELREMGNMKIGMLVTLKNLARMVDGDSRSAVLSNISPVVSKNGNRPAAKTTALNHLALFEEDKMIASLQEPESRGLLLIRNEMETINFSFPLKGTEGEVSINLLDASAKLIPRIGSDGNGGCASTCAYPEI
ncbi:hypothetical protein D3H35_18890 [Cohnella faecalis]|uniref:Spore germination GerAC-like C-terminal domain-containing protein n=1 Tax=Cohnella faecalis TaxID=2315694 RepID=A0A398CSE7_9BACL|nr:Ger(x)C family spore germination C-terminal domain-containing protein [Cohnella faecalis]RIE02717.1 hypothetical protein D3H35_18890 [Cohnella faecalis]